MAREVTALVISERKELAAELQQLVEAIEGIHCTISTCSLEGAVEIIQQTNPSLVVLDLSQDEEEGLKLGLHITRNFPYTVLVFTAKEATADLILKSVRTGARDFWHQPFNSQEVGSVFAKVSLEGEPREEKWKLPSKIISVFSNKGGVGTTTVACNLAVFLTEITKKKVVLADLVLQHGDVAVFLDIRPVYTITNIIENIHRLDNALLMSALAKHSSGLAILPGPVQAEEADFISGDQIKQVVNLMKSNFDYIIVDAGHEFNDHVIAVLDISDFILVVTALDLPTIRNTKGALDIMNRLRYDRHKMRVVVNRYDAKGQLTLSDVEKNLGCPVMHCLPNDYLTVISAINSGQPVSKISKRARITQGFEKLAKLITGGLPEHPVAAKKHGGFLSMLGGE